MVLLIGGSVLAGLGLLIGGLVVGAWAERHLIGLQLEAAGDEGLLDPPDIDGAPGALRVAVVRAFALLPVAAVCIVAWQPLYDAAYHELVLPDELRRHSACASWAMCRGWSPPSWWPGPSGDAAAALGVRRLVIGRRPILVAWLLGWIDIVRRPVRVIAIAVFGIIVFDAPHGAVDGRRGHRLDPRPRRDDVPGRRRGHADDGRDLGRGLAGRAGPRGRRRRGARRGLVARVDARSTGR